MKRSSVVYAIATALGVGLCASSARAQDNRFSQTTPLPSVATGGSAGQDMLASEILTSDAPARLVPSPSRVVPASFCDACDTCNSDCCECDKFYDPQNPAGYTYKWAPDKWAKVGAGIRGTFNSTTDLPGGPLASNTSLLLGRGGNYLAVANARLFISGQVGECIGFALNSEINGAQNGPFLNNTTISYPTTYDLLDAIIKYELDDTINFWSGMFHPPSDRSNIDGPFFINAWDLPFVSNYPTVFQGRQIGAAYWGQLGGGMLKWSVGAFNGTGRTLNLPSADGINNLPIAPGPPNPNGQPLETAARVVVNFLDPEPGYYNQSTYYGKKDILAIGYAIQTQNNAVGTSATASNFTGMNVDGLYETKLDDDGVVTFEGAWYRYNDQNLVPTVGVPLTNSQAAQQGNAYFVFAGYMFPQVICPCSCVEGRLRPWARYQNYHHDEFAAAAAIRAFRQGVDAGVDYIINGHNARLTAFWGDRDVVGDGREQIFRLGAQLIY